MGYLTYSQLGRYGRFANGAFQICSTIGLARKHRMGFKFPLWINHDHRDRFGSKEDVDIYKHLVNELPLWTGEVYPEVYVPWGFHEVNISPGNWDLLGHMQCDRYFENSIDEVRHYMTFKDEPPKNDYTCIHIRLGDYDDKFHPRQTMEYYSRGMEIVGGPFLVFSDELETVRGWFGDRVEYAKDGNYLEHFKLMKNCKNFIIGNSSYSLLASILATGEKKIVSPKNWFGEAWGDARHSMGQDVHPRGAIVI